MSSKKRQRAAKKPSKSDSPVIRSKDKARSPTDGGHSKRARFLLLGLVAAVLLVYANSLSGGFVLDDFVYIVQNDNIRTFDNIFSRNGHQEPRPPVYASLAVNYALGKLDPTGYHLFNILVHLLAALTLFSLVRQTLLLPKLRNRYGPSSDLLAFVVALLWAVHPLQTESVTYIFQRAESMQAFFFLLAMYSYLSAASARGARKALWTICLILASALGMTSKATFITLPAVLILYDRVFLASSWREVLGGRSRLLGAALAAMLIAGLAVGDVKGMAAKQVEERAETRTDLLMGRADNPAEYYRSQPAIILHYLWLGLWPSDLCLDYKLEPATSVSQIVLSSMGLLVLLGVTVILLLKAPGLGFLMAFVFIVLSPTAAYWKLELMFEHRMYLPLAGLVGAVVFTVDWLVSRLLAQKRWSRRSIRVVLIAVVLATASALGARSILRNRDYQDRITMYEKVIETRPENPRAHYNLANRYRDQSRELQKEGKPDEANALMERAISH